MISVAHETLIPLRDAPKHLPPRPNGKRVHISAIYRWVGKGVAGVVLESVKIGGTTYISVEALQRFADRLTADPTTVSAAVTVPGRTARRREQASAELASELGLSQGAVQGHPQHGAHGAIDRAPGKR